jgi:DtxR family transcriptional regulator, Mn-dependent transcriptional regulator
MRNNTGPLTSAIEDYLKAIFTLQTDDAPATTSALARAMGVTDASATNMVKKLAARKLAHYERYHGVRLTPTGERIALEIVRHHRLLELFLTKTLGMPWDQVHDEAHKLEHVLSDNLEGYVADLLGQPTEDPYGDPIPSATGQVEQVSEQRMADLEPNSTVVIHRVNSDDPAHLRFFAELGLIPHATIGVVGREPFGGPLHVLLPSGEERSLGEGLANEIWVEAPARAGHGEGRPHARRQARS